MDFRHNAIPPKMMWVQYPDLTCSKSGLTCYELGVMILKHHKNWGSVKWDGKGLDEAYHAGCFDEEVFTAAFECADKQVVILAQQERELNERIHALRVAECR